MQTYDEILSRMREKYRSLTGAMPFETSDIGVRLRVLSGELYSVEVYIEWLKRQMKSTTAEGEWLEYHAMQRGIKRSQATKSSGEVIFSLSATELADVVIPAGTVVCTEDGELCFETTSEGVIFKGTTTAHVPVKALKEGKAYNVKALSVNSFVTPVALVTSVTNPDPFEGGSDTEDDESLRKRIADSLSNASCAANAAYYRNTATSVEGVASACVVPRERGAGTVDIYIAAQGAEVTDETLQRVQELMSREREVNVDVLVKKAQAATINYYLEIELESGYEFEKVSEECKLSLESLVAKTPVGGSIMLTKAGEQIAHIEGVSDYAFRNFTNKSIRLNPNQFAVIGYITVKEGIE